MATITVYSDAVDNYVNCSSTVYADARSGAGTLTEFSGVNVSYVGQVFSSPNYSCREAFTAFDTTGISGATAATLGLNGSTATLNHFTIEARLGSWGPTVTTADFIDGSALSATLLATYDTSTGWVTSPGSWNDFTETGSALSSNINPSGFTYLTLNSDRHRLGTTPTGLETVSFENAKAAGTTSDPKLVITAPAAVSSDDILNPWSDEAINSWTTDTGGTTDLYAAIDELTASDTDYIQSPAGPTTAQYYETALETHADPASSSGHVVHYRYQKNVAGGNVGLTVGLVNNLGDTLLTADQAGFEGSTAGWQAIATSTIARSTAQARTGAASLEITQTAGTSFVVSSPLIDAVAGRTYDVSAYWRAATTARNVGVGLQWKDAVGATISTTYGTNISDISSTWTQGTHSATAPALTEGLVINLSVAGGSPGDIHYVDDVVLTEPNTYGYLASWSHTNIPNTWTQQDQTLTAPQADSITDYADLRLRFTPDMVATDQTVPVPTKVADRASANSNTATTTVDLVLTSLTVGNYLLIRSAANNVGGGGSATSFTLSNLVGTAIDLATDQVFQANVDPGAAGVGATCSFAIVKISATLGTVRITYGGSVVQACVAEEWSGIHATTPIVGTPVAATGTNVTTFVNTPAMTDTSVALGNVVYGLIAVEGPSSDTYTQDADTTNGSWVSLTKLGTTIATADLNQTTYGAYKTVTATGAQTYNPTGSVARDSAGLIVELAAAPTPAATIKAQVSWANLELPAGVTAFPHYAGINLGVNWPVDGAISAGATDS